VTPVTWLLGIALALVLLAAGLVQVAHRLDQLNLRVQAAGEGLRAARAERSAAALELAASGALDPAASLLLADAAHRVREALDRRAPPDLDRDGGAGDSGRVGQVERAETDLTEAIRALALQAPWEDLDQADAFDDLDRAGRTLSIARRLYNDAAAQCGRLHAAQTVRWFRLAGRSSPPPTLDFDDQAPALGPAEEHRGR
jgi:hypothetical protein